MAVPIPTELAVNAESVANDVIFHVAHTIDDNLLPPSVMCSRYLPGNDIMICSGCFQCAAQVLDSHFNVPVTVTELIADSFEDLEHRRADIILVQPVK